MAGEQRGRRGETWKRHIKGSGLDRGSHMYSGGDLALLTVLFIVLYLAKPLNLSCEACLHRPGCPRSAGRLPRNRIMHATCRTAKRRDLPVDPPGQDGGQVTNCFLLPCFP